MRVNAIDGATEPFLVITMSPKEAEELQGVACCIPIEGPGANAKSKLMYAFEALLNEGLEKIKKLAP